MTIDLPVTWIEPGPERTANATVTFDEVKLPEGYHVRKITGIAFPPGFPREQQEASMKPIYHALNRVRQLENPDAVVKP